MGTISSGHIRAGQEVRVTRTGQTARLARIVTADGDLPEAGAGAAVTLTLEQEVDASRGDVLSLSDAPLQTSDQFEATVVWLHEEPGLVGRTYELKLATQWAGASLTTIKHRVDVNQPSAREAARRLSLNDIGVCNIALSRAVAFTPYRTLKALGSFILVDRFTHATVAAGLLHHSLRRADHVHHQSLTVRREDRERLNGHPGRVIWFTGLSGSGKSTLANALEQALHQRGLRTYLLDGDNVRQGLNKDLGFTEADRVENIRRVAEVARLMADAGLVVLTAFISPFRQERRMARELIGEATFVEVFVDTPLEVCEQRDPKGLYRKARQGLIPNFTGIGSPYETPLDPEVVVRPQDTLEETVSRLAQRCLAPDSPGTA
jgi:bifunctional enzyme CysN/CysC